jgi:hypothetical protein
MIFPEVLGEQFVHEDVGIIFVNFDFFEDDAAFAFDLSCSEGGIEDEVGEDVEGNGDVVGEGLHIETDGLFAGEGVEVAANGVHFAGDVLGSARSGALENHVFDEVGDSVDFGGLTTGAGFYPGAHGYRADMFHALGEDDEAVRQDSTAKISLSRHWFSIGL